MNNSNANPSSSSTILKLEIFWWIFTIVLIAGILFPIRNTLNDYPFLYTNIIYIFVFITFTRYIFLLPYTFFAHWQGFKLIILFLCIPIVFLLIQELNNFQTYLDYNGVEALLGRTDSEITNGLIRYTYNEMILFAVGSIISSVIFPFRLAISLWRGRNKGTA
ncbi:MAG: hypothetical protein IPJ74_16385 [Saprospiraceae bacterium]|nr:hypothetical protein [Saprospiraceae bacterium]